MVKKVTLDPKNFYPDCPDCESNIFVSRETSVHLFRCQLCDRNFTPDAWRGFNDLTNRERRAFLLCEIGGYGYGEIREMTRQAAKDAVSRAIDKLEYER